MVELFRGTVDGAQVHPREIVKELLRLNAVSAIIAHNHPSQNCEPSAADEMITKRIQEALATIDIRLLDHLLGGFGTVTADANRPKIQLVSILLPAERRW
jgi:DNA repair protein RadC